LQFGGFFVWRILICNGKPLRTQNLYTRATARWHIRVYHINSNFEIYKGKIRKSGTGCVTMINDHLYEGRFTPRVNGKRISKNVYAKTREECEEKLAELIKTMKAEIAEMKKQAKNA